MRAEKKGFTLIELLVVISIIALLLSIMIPSLKKAKFAAQRVLCVNNMRQQAIIQQSYAVNNNGKFAEHNANVPYVVRDMDVKESSGRETERCRESYDAYVTDSEVFICPAIKHFAVQAPYDWGLCADTEWYSDYYATDKGGWDAVIPNTEDRPRYVIIPYNWYANFTAGGQTITFLEGERPWPKTSSQCSSTSGMISHIYMSDKGPSKFRDMSHGGSVLAWTRLNETTESQDTPMAYSDGHVKIIRANSAKIRATYGNVMIAY
jgi:prepilin-type N-terminal cleavage/methylation domain-containing protein